MNNLIVVYDSHEKAIDAVTILKQEGYTSKNLSIIGRADKARDAAKLSDKEIINVAGAEVGAGVTLGSVLGVLAGVGVFAIPGLGFLYGAGALVGAIAGFDIGLVAGGVASALTVAGIKVAETKKYDDYIEDGNMLVIVQGSANEIEKAGAILKSGAKPVDIEKH